MQYIYIFIYLWGKTYSGWHY